MKPLRLVPVALLLLAILCTYPASNAQNKSQPLKETIQVSVDRVDVGVIVTDRQGHFVASLRREDFRVFDNSIEQPLTSFTAIEEPAQVVLLIEAGPAVYFLESSHVWAANSLLSGLSADDRIAVVKYSDSPEAILDFTSDKNAVATSLGQLHFNLGFGSLNLSTSVSKVLEWLKSVQNKKTIVLLATGVDTSPPNESALMMRQLKISDVRLLIVSLTGGLQSPPPGRKKNMTASSSSNTAEQFEEANQLLKKMAESSGGRAYFPANANEFSSAYAEIAQLVRHEYSLAFAPPVSDGAVHSIEVQVGPPKAFTPNAPVISYRIDHRQSYVAPAAK